MNATKKITGVLIVVMATLLFCADVWADSSAEIGVVVFELEGEGVEEELLTTLTSVLRQEALQHETYSLVTPTALQRNDVALIVGCNAEDVECLRQMADYVEGEVLIFGEVRRHSGGLTIVVDILNTKVGEAPIRVERTVADGDDPVGAFQREVADLFRDLDSLGETHLVIRAPSDEVEIRLQGVMVGRGEVERRGLPPGEYEIILGERASPLWQGSAELIAAETTEVRPDVEIAPAPPTSEPQRPSVGDQEARASVESPGSQPMRREEPRERLRFDEEPRSNLGAYSIMGVGASALAGSGVMVYFMRRTEQTIAQENAAGTMTASRYDALNDRGNSFQTAHYVLLGAGIAGIAVGGGWVLWSLRQERALRAGAPAMIEIQATLSGLSVSARW